MNKTKLDEYKNVLEIFLKDYKVYIASYQHYNESYGRNDLKTTLQRQSNLVSRIVNYVHGGCTLNLTESKSINFYQALLNVLTANVSEKTRNFIESNVEATLNEAIGNIVNGTIPSKKTKPVLPINDQILNKRCSDLLNAPGSFDRVINQATQVLEDRLRAKLPFEKLCEIIPEAKNQIGENLVHKLLAPPNPSIVVSDKPEERSAFHKMIVGMIAYLRNPSHHSLNDDTEWSLAWSVVGIVDSLLSELDNSFVSGDEPKTKGRKAKQ